MAKSATKDMTVGSPMKLILSFSMPLLIGFIFQQFYSVVDTFIVGRTLGMNALAGVGATGSINFLIVGFVMGVSFRLHSVLEQRIIRTCAGMWRTVCGSELSCLW